MRWPPDACGLRRGLLKRSGWAALLDNLPWSKRHELANRVRGLWNRTARADCVAGGLDADQDPDHRRSHYFVRGLSNLLGAQAYRSEESRVGKECVSPCRVRVSRFH